MTERLRYVLALFAGVPFAALYLVLTHQAFRSVITSHFYIIMSIGFLFVVPFAVGALTVALAPRQSRCSMPYAVVMSAVSCALAMLPIAVLNLEALVCIVMALPLFLVLSILGGAAMVMHYQSARPPREQGTLLALVLLAPYLVTPLESRIPAPDSARTVRNSVVIAADPQMVWERIIRVRPIGERELQPSLAHWIGLPRPIEATLSHEGVGAVRHATFEGGLTFVETVTEWQDRQAIGFSIRRDLTEPVVAPLDGVGGPNFEVLDGRYVVEPRADGTVILHLSSTHRLTTRFNAYAGLWTDWIMSDLQQSILDVIKGRAEGPRVAS